MDALRQKLKELSSAFVESFRAIVWGRFFSTSLQTQLSILQILRNLFLRIGAVESRLRGQEYTYRKVTDTIENYLKSVDQRIENICLLEKKVIDHLQVLLRYAGAVQEDMQTSDGDPNICENHLIEFLLPWVGDKTVIHLGEHQENLGETMLKIGFKRVFAFELNFEGTLPLSAGLLKFDGREHDIEIFKKLPKNSNYQVIMYGFQNKSSSELYQQEEIARCLRDLNYPFSISLINYRDGGGQFVANIPPRIMDVWGSTLCFQESALFEKAHTFISSQLPVKRVFR